MSAPSRLFAYLYAAPETHDDTLNTAVRPLLAGVQAAPELHSASFLRSSDPEPLIRVLVRGAREWLDRAVLPVLPTYLEACGRFEVCDERGYPEYAREIERWGGSAGIDLAERTFQCDTWLVLDRLELEQQGATGRSRREFHLLAVHRLLDLFRLAAEERLEFYRAGHAWPVARGEWTAEDVQAIEEKYTALRPALADLLAKAARGDAVGVWGGAAAAESAESRLAAFESVAGEWNAARAAGHLEQDWIQLLWGLAHLQALRLGIHGHAEAVLRYFVCRLLEDGVAA